jgi:hypothetical protein
MILGAAGIARWWWAALDLVNLMVAKGFEVVWVSTTTIWEDFRQGESFQIFLGRKGILASGDEVNEEPLVISIVDGAMVVAVAVAEAAKSWWGCVWAVLGSGSGPGSGFEFARPFSRARAIMSVLSGDGGGGLRKG